MKDKGILFWRKRWFSICSIHQGYNKDCILCNIGGHKNLFILKISSIVYKISPKFWIWYNN